MKVRIAKPQARPHRPLATASRSVRKPRPHPRSLIPFSFPPSSFHHLHFSVLPSSFCLPCLPCTHAAFFPRTAEANGTALAVRAADRRQSAVGRGAKEAARRRNGGDRPSRLFARRRFSAPSTGRCTPGGTNSTSSCSKASPTATSICCLDCSPSMGLGRPAKFQLARQIAAALGYVSLMNLDRLVVAAFADGLAADLPPLRHASRILRLLRFLEELSPAGQEDRSAARRRDVRAAAAAAGAGRSDQRPVRPATAFETRLRSAAVLRLRSATGAPGRSQRRRAHAAGRRGTYRRRIADRHERHDHRADRAAVSGLGGRISRRRCASIAGGGASSTCRSPATWPRTRSSCACSAAAATVGWALARPL